MNIPLKSAWALTLVAGVASLAMATPKATPPPAPPTAAEVGQKAPAFTLSDTAGKQHTLKDYAGKIVVLEWFNADCPFSGKDTRKSVHASGRAAALRSQLKAADPSIVYLLIDSTARRATKSGVIAADKAAKKRWKIDAPILIDFDGAVGRAYKARTTPHMFVIDSTGVLQYDGAFDDDKRGAAGDEASNYVLAAVKKLKAGEAPSPSKTKSWGCSVKYGS